MQIFSRGTKIFAALPLLAIVSIYAFNCRETLQDNEITYLEWPILKQCLAEVNSETLKTNTSLNIWRLLKIAFDGIENIPVEAFKQLGYTLTAIPLDELRNLSMERVEIVEAFGAIRSNADENLEGFNDEQSALIAQKVRFEWIGKNPDTYSEYDMISMGEILCQMNATDIEQMHADAFKNAVEWIGNIKNCPQDRLQAFAKLAVQDEAFGQPSTWSKLDVSIVGNILNGLLQSDIASIDKDKLHLNHYYRQQNKNNTSGDKGNKIKSQSANQGSNNQSKISTKSDENTAAQSEKKDTKKD